MNMVKINMMPHHSVALVLTLQCGQSLFSYRALMRRAQTWQLLWLQGAIDVNLMGLAQMKHTSVSSAFSSFWASGLGGTACCGGALASAAVVSAALCLRRRPLPFPLPPTR